MNTRRLATIMDDHDAVLSVISDATNDFYLKSIKSIVRAMRNSGIRRLICVTSFYTRRKKLKLFGYEKLNIWLKFYVLLLANLEHYPNYYYDVLQPEFGDTLYNMFCMEGFLFKYAADIQFTIVRPPPLSYEPQRCKLKKKLILL
jgi:hypothetical protein